MKEGFLYFKVGSISLLFVQRLITKFFDLQRTVFTCEYSTVVSKGKLLFIESAILLFISIGDSRNALLLFQYFPSLLK